jgi:hypothetical protein
VLVRRLDCDQVWVVGGGASDELMSERCVGRMSVVDCCGYWLWIRMVGRESDVSTRRRVDVLVHSRYYMRTMSAFDTMGRAHHDTRQVLKYISAV